jgi:non-canonical purine NTP pyrophosphatase (RdgB/HAM1 family)
MKKLIFATGNEGKMREVREMLEGTGIECISMKEAGFDGEVDETGTTFEENALIKARTVAKALNLPVLPDDSGLEVDILIRHPESILPALWDMIRLIQSRIRQLLISLKEWKEMTVLRALSAQWHLPFQMEQK